MADPDVESRLEMIRALGDWMRETGATRARLPDGTELELGPMPAKPRAAGDPAPQLTAEEAEIARREKKDATLFGSSSMRPRRVPLVHVKPA